MQINDATFVVTDTETTGTHKGARVIELAAVKVVGGQTVDTFQQLVNPQESVPPRITRLTGITTGMVFGAPSAKEVLPRYLKFLGDNILVAHSLSFDRRIIDGELARLERPACQNRMLCTLRLARRLLHELPSKGLSSLIEHYNISMRPEDRHRALGDAKATAAVLQRLLAHYRFARNTNRVQDLLAFQYARYRKARPVKKNVKRIRQEVLGHLPKAPGIYFLQDKDHQPLYIGKARSLKNRVQTYFTGIEAHQQRIKKLVQSVQNVSWQEMDSELDALLAESRLIKTHKPRFNRQGRRYRSYPFLHLLPSAQNEPLNVVHQTSQTEGEYYGPLASRRRTDEVANLLRFLFGLTNEAAAEINSIPRVVGPEAPLEKRLEKLRAYLCGKDQTAVKCIETKMYAASEQLQFEQARWLRDQWEHLEDLFERQRWLGGRLRNYYAVVVDMNAWNEKTRFFFVAGGCLVGRWSWKGAADQKLRYELRRRVNGYLRQNSMKRSLFTKAEVNRLRILLQWAHNNSEQTLHMRQRAGQTADKLTDGLLKKMWRKRAA